MDLWQAILLGLVEGFTEFLPDLETGHLTILEKLLGYTLDDPDITAFTAIIQSGRCWRRCCTCARTSCGSSPRLVPGVRPRRSATTRTSGSAWR